MDPSVPILYRFVFLKTDHLIIFTDMCERSVTLLW